MFVDMDDLLDALAMQPAACLTFSNPLVPASADDMEGYVAMEVEAVGWGTQDGVAISNAMDLEDELDEEFEMAGCEWAGRLQLWLDDQEQQIDFSSGGMDSSQRDVMTNLDIRDGSSTKSLWISTDCPTSMLCAAINRITWSNVSFQVLRELVQHALVIRQAATALDTDEIAKVLVSVVMMPRLEGLKDDAPRILHETLALFAQRAPDALIDGLIVPLLKDIAKCSQQVEEVIKRLVKNEFRADSKWNLLLRLSQMGETEWPTFVLKIVVSILTQVKQPDKPNMNFNRELTTDVLIPLIEHLNRSVLVLNDEKIAVSQRNLHASTIGSIISILVSTKHKVQTIAVKPRLEVIAKRITHTIQGKVALRQVNTL